MEYSNSGLLFNSIKLTASNTTSVTTNEEYSQVGMTNGSKVPIYRGRFTNHIAYDLPPSSSSITGASHDYINTSDLYCTTCQNCNALCNLCNTGCHGSCRHDNAGCGGRCNESCHGCYSGCTSNCTSYTACDNCNPWHVAACSCWGCYDCNGCYQTCVGGDSCHTCRDCDGTVICPGCHGGYST